nr:DNA-directed RNA polymerase subunit delta [Xylocopilactobacillus apis]
MIEVAYEILKANQNEMSFKDLYKEIGKYLGKTKKDLDKSIVDFYTDLNVDGSFISLGNDIWGLRDWYPFESVDEETNHNEDVKEMSDKSSSNYDEDDDVIDYIETDEDSESTSTATTSITDQFSSSTLESDNFLDDDEENQVEEDPQSAEEDLSDFSEDDDTDDDDDDL